MTNLLGYKNLLDSKTNLRNKDFLGVSELELDVRSSRFDCYNQDFNLGYCLVVEVITVIVLYVMTVIIER